MSPGMVEEAGQTARSAIDALKASPSCLLAILLAAMFALLTYFSLTAEREESSEREMAMIERCFPVALMQAIQKRAVSEYPDRPPDRRDE